MDVENKNSTATVMVGKCRQTGDGFGIRVENNETMWVANWCFKISNTAAASEGYDRTKISGAIATSKDYPGCPYCGAKGFFQCGKCGKITCWNGETTVTCKWCGNTGRTSQGNFDVDGTSY